jgi:DNA mismatch repair protein PMS2
MLASRACRSSIMIGRALDAAMMRRILGRLAGLDAPWNCPHGRPTMRHLAVLPGGAPALGGAAEAADDAGGE